MGITKTVLCFGDSLTWGYDPAGTGRHAFEDRWPNVLAAALGPQVHVIAEGLNGRTSAYDDHTADAERNGAKALPGLLHSHMPLDLVILMLGINDLKPQIAGTARGARAGIQRLVTLVRRHDYSFGFDAPRVLIVAPPPVRAIADPVFAAYFRAMATESALLAPLYRGLAEELGCGFFDAASVAEASPLDGVHLSAEATSALGHGLEPITRAMLGLEIVVTD